MQDNIIPGTIRRNVYHDLHGSKDYGSSHLWVVIDENTWRPLGKPDDRRMWAGVKHDSSEIVGRLPPHQMDASHWDDLFKLPDGCTEECEWTAFGWIALNKSHLRVGWKELEPGVVFFHPNPRRPEEYGELVAMPRKGPRGVLNEHGVPFRRLNVSESSTFVLKNSLIKEAVIVGWLHPDRMTATEMTDEFKLPKKYDPHRDDLYFNPGKKVWEHAPGGWLEKTTSGRSMMKAEGGWVISHAWNPPEADWEDDVVEEKSEDPERKWSWRGFTIYQNVNGSFDARDSEGKLIVGHGGGLLCLLEHILAKAIESYVDEREKQLQLQIENLKNQVATYERYAFIGRPRPEETVQPAPRKLLKFVDMIKRWW